VKNEQQVTGLITEFLAAIFPNMTIVKDITQTKVEEAIYAEVSGEVDVRITPTQGLELKVPAVIAMRQANGNDAIGYMSLKLATTNYDGDQDIVLKSTESTETVEILNETETIISKRVIFQITVDADQCRELIKVIELNQTGV
jgi:hypothetical protein